MSHYRAHARIGTARQLEILLNVFETGSITAAAETLHLTQPSVSMQLAKLADNLGVPLYYAVGRSIRFTEAGELCAERAREILRQYEYLDLSLQNLSGLETGSLRVAVVTTAKYFIPHLIGQFSERFPKIDVLFNVGNRDSIIARTEADSDDFYLFSHPPENPDLELTEFIHNNLLAIAPVDHPLSRLRKIPLKTFMKEKFLMREEGSGTRHAIETFLAKRNCDFNLRMTIESNEAIKHAVMSGLGVSIISEHTLSFGGNTGVAVLNVEGLPISTQWYLVRRKSRPLSAAAARFMEFMTGNESHNLIEQNLLR